MATLEEARAQLVAEQTKLRQAGEMGQMLLAKCTTIETEAAEKEATMQREIDELKAQCTANSSKMNDLEAKNEHLQAKNEEYAKLVKEMEAENEGLLDEAGTKEGDASNAARRAKAELEVRCKEMGDQVETYRAELEQARSEVDALSKAKDRLKAEKDDISTKLQESEDRSSSMELILKEKDAELRTHSKSAEDDAQGEVRAIKEKNDGMLRDLELMKKKMQELQDVNNILTKQHDDDQTLLEDVKATNMMLREALETKELEWGTSDSNLASFAPKESLLGEIEQHFNRFQTFASPQRGSSKMPNFMDVVKRDFENLAHRIHRLRQKMEKKWPEPAQGLPGGVTGSPAIVTPSSAVVTPSAAEPPTA